jgi:hypothetical protein
VVQGPVLSRLLGMESSEAATSSAPRHHGSKRAEWMVIAATALLVLLWHIYQQSRNLL